MTMSCAAALFPFVRGIAMAQSCRSLALALVALAAAGAVQAQTSYPDKPIRLVVGFGAGGPTDLPARFIADKLVPLLGQRVVVENKNRSPPSPYYVDREIARIPRID